MGLSCREVGTLEIERVVTRRTDGNPTKEYDEDTRTNERTGNHNGK